MSKINVVVVDDDQSLAYIIRDNINKTEYFQVVGVCHDGEAAIGMIQDKQPDLVILDIIMPNKDGLAVLEYFQDHEGVDFIVLSAIGHDLVTKRAVSLGAMYYIVKPFDIQILMDRMSSLYLGEKHSSGGRDQVRHLEEYIGQELGSIGVPMHVKGYQYIKDAVMMIIHHEDVTLKITKSVYPALASRHGTTSTSVERAIRNAIDLTFNRVEQEQLNLYFNQELFNNKVTNKEFIIRVASAVREKI